MSTKCYAIYETLKVPREGLLLRKIYYVDAMFGHFFISKKNLNFYLFVVLIKDEFIMRPMFPQTRYTAVNCAVVSLFTRQVP